MGNATYIIAGGFGGLGRSAAHWMARRGARNLILLSRSGPKSPAAHELLIKLRNAGVRVEPPLCDVSSSSSLSAVLESCGTMPPIKGCLQATMVLKVQDLFNHPHCCYTSSDNIPTLGFHLRKHDLLRLDDLHPLQSRQYPKPARPPPPRPRFLHHALLRGGHRRLPRPIKLCRRQYLPGRLGSPPALPRPQSHIHRPRRYGRDWNSRRE